jgi:phage-related protein (TIGR01555 family)
MSRKNKQASLKNPSNKDIQNSTAQGINHFLPFQINNRLSNILCGENIGYLTNKPQLIAEIWHKNWIAGAIVEIPIKDAFKEAPEVKTDLATEEEIEKAVLSFKYTMYSKLLNFFYSVRAFGTAYLIVMPKGFKDGKVEKRNLSLPLKQSEILNAKEIELIIASPYEIYDRNAIQNNIALLNLESEVNEECPYMYYSQILHKSRVIKMIASEPPLIVRQFLHTGGGLSVFEDILREMEQYLIMKKQTLTFVNEGKLDIILKRGYTEMQAENQGVNFENALQSKLQNKDFNTTLVFDANDTEYQQKQLNLGNLDNLNIFFERNLLQATGIPIKRFGVLSSNGFSDSDKTTEQNYNKTLTFIQNWGREVILMLYKIVFLRELEYIPEDLDVEFPSLDVLSELEKQTLSNQVLDNILKVNDKVEMSAEDLVDLINNFKVFKKDIDIKVQDKSKE